MNLLTLSSENWLYYEREFSSADRNRLHYIFKFPNNFGASVVKSEYSYGGTQDLWEIALIKFTNDNDYQLEDYEDFEQDVIGWLSDWQVDEYLTLIRLYSVPENRDDRTAIMFYFSKELNDGSGSIETYDTTMGTLLNAIRTAQNEYPEYYFVPEGSPEYGYSVTVYKKDSCLWYMVEPGVLGKWTQVEQ